MLAMVAAPLAGAARNLWDAPNLLMQKFPAETFTVTTLLSAREGDTGDRAGLVVFGADYAWIGIRKQGAQWQLVHTEVEQAEKGGAEAPMVLATLAQPTVELRLHVAAGAECVFTYRTANGSWTPVTSVFRAKAGKWVGAKFGMFATGVSPQPAKASPLEARFNYVRVTTTGPISTGRP